jgi:hypothetical protein
MELARAEPLRPRRRWLLVAVLSALLLLSVCLWLDTQEVRREIALLPGGDVAFGFCSYQGAIRWIEIAPWYDGYWNYPIWSVTWGTVMIVQLVAILSLIGHSVRRQSRCPE